MFPSPVQSKSSKEQLLAMWGESLEGEQDVWDVFHAYLTGTCNPKTGKKVTKVRNCKKGNVCFI